MKAIVIFDSRFGNTEKIAKSLAAGLAESEIQTTCTNAKEANLESLREYDLIAVGAPTEMITASKSTKEFLDRLGHIDLTGKFGFAFDTKLPYPLTGSAAKLIEKELKGFGLEILAPRASAIVLSDKKIPKEQGGVRLKDGEEKRFEQIGLQLATTRFAAKKEVIVA